MSYADKVFIQNCKDIIDSGVNSKNLKKVTEKYAIQYDGKPLNSDMLRDFLYLLVVLQKTS